jgi:hypothetical protein
MVNTIKHPNKDLDQATRNFAAVLREARDEQILSVKFK